MPYRAFAFDLDETLADVEHHHSAATHALLEARALDAAQATIAFKDVTGKRTRDIIDALREHSSIPDALDDLLRERHHAFRASLRGEPPVPMPGALELVQELGTRGPVVLVTSGYQEDAFATLEGLGLRDTFKAVVTGEDVHHPKPHPEPYLTAAKKAGVPPEEMIAFEDSVRGMQAARDAGMTVVGVPNPRNTRPEDAMAVADCVLGSLVEAFPVDEFLRDLAHARAKRDTSDGSEAEEGNGPAQI